MKIIYSARRQEQEDTQYLPLDVQGLIVTTEHLGGTGAVNTPKRLRVTLQNVSETRWSGVVRIEFCKKAENAKVFMPGFMYGRNRAEAPLTTPRKFPRIRKGEPSLPASPFWMVP